MLQNASVYPKVKQTTFFSTDRHPLAKKFLNARITFLLSQSHNPLILQRLSECHYMLGDVDTALHYIEEACKTTSSCDKEISWQLAIVKRQHGAKEKQKELQKQIRSEELTMPQSMHVSLEMDTCINNIQIRTFKTRTKHNIIIIHKLAI